MAHATLRPGVNMILIALWAVLGATMSLAGPSAPTVPLTLAAVVGVTVGLLQRQSLREAAPSFRSAKTALDVRHVLASTRPGRAGLWIQWGGAALIFASAFLYTQPYVAALAGYAAFMCVRDAVALPEVTRLARQGA